MRQKASEPVAKLRISSRNYSSWSMRGWLILRLSGLPFRTEVAQPDDPRTRAELLLNSSSILLPCLEHDGAAVWDTLGIAEYLNELRPEAGLFPQDRLARARCRSICGEMHAGFHALRSSLPMNLKAHVHGFTVWSAARADIERILHLWRGCLEEWGGPWLFGAERCVADAMFAPVVTRFRTYEVKLDEVCEGYARTIEGWADFREWVEAAQQEPEARITELEFDAEF
ncbi:glutathione S-transferase [Roseococcus sp. SYP-B2431]|uniref:glutathione S-transferase n=1 Tax=Roseococcus sp. SYP-B2431 TaxID=2496640 RepID=UPI00103C50AC|nr:glutathione S-transferase [Roseococcus sp. SYP-B2431]TCI00408.1 glutathione S-transferase [Roseococcus sp. SYP-B2431]